MFSPLRHAAPADDKKNSAILGFAAHFSLAKFPSELILATA
jgi:hypothetical protein